MSKNDEMSDAEFKAFQLEEKLRKDFNCLAQKCPDIANELLIDFRETAQDNSIRNPADAPADHHSCFHGVVQSYLGDLDCDGDW